MNYLKGHPFAVEAHFDSSLVLTFAVPKEEIQNLIPTCLELDTFQDKWAFIAVAMVQTTGLRPKGFPKILGNDFFLIGYRIFVRFHSNSGKRLRGLYIIKSETNRKLMEIMGNIFTHYDYSTTDIRLRRKGALRSIESNTSNLKLIVEDTEEEIALPAESPFSDWKEARRFAGPLPFSFTYEEESKTVLIIEGVRQNWKPNPVKVIDSNFDYINRLNLTGLVLANAFEITNVPYHWKKGRKEIWG